MIRRTKLIAASSAPHSMPTRSSFQITRRRSDSAISLTAIPRIIMVLAWLPELPPVSMSVGMNPTSSGIAANVAS